MSNLKTALLGVGYKPPIKRPPVKERLLQKLAMHVLVPLKRPRKIQITKAGGFFKARWQGEASCVFGTSRFDAKERLLSGRLPGSGK